MALNFSNGKASAAALFSRRIAASTFISRRKEHESAYEKNTEKKVVEAKVESVVEDVVGKPDEYWAPHPKTGVFVPEDEKEEFCGSDDLVEGEGSSTVLDQSVAVGPYQDDDKVNDI